MFLRSIAQDQRQDLDSRCAGNKQLLDEVEHDIMNYQKRGLCYLPKPKAEADNTEQKVMVCDLWISIRFVCFSVSRFVAGMIDGSDKHNCEGGF